MAIDDTAEDRAIRERLELPVEERIRLWCHEYGGEEVEHVIDLIIAAENEIRRLKGLPERTE